MTALPVAPGSTVSGLQVFSALVSAGMVVPSDSWIVNSVGSHRIGSFPLFLMSKPSRKTGAPLVVIAISVKLKFAVVGPFARDGAGAALDSADGTTTLLDSLPLVVVCSLWLHPKTSSGMLAKMAIKRRVFMAAPRASWT